MNSDSKQNEDGQVEFSGATGSLAGADFGRKLGNFNGVPILERMTIEGLVYEYVGLAEAVQNGHKIKGVEYRHAETGKSILLHPVAGR